MVAMKGCPIAPSTDMGGSIRAPAAFNGLYAIRPTSQRIPKGGWGGSVSGQISVRDSAGPVCHSVDDLKLLTEVIGSHNSQHRYDTNSVPIPWRQISLPEGKLAVGIMKWDGVVMPHPPILRAIEETKQSLLRHGFEGAPPLLISLKDITYQRDDSSGIRPSSRFVGAHPVLCMCPRLGYVVPSVTDLISTIWSFKTAG